MDPASSRIGGLPRLGLELIRDCGGAANKISDNVSKIQYENRSKKTNWVHVMGTEVLETPTVERDHITRIQQVTYLGPVLDANGDPSSAVRANAQRAKQPIIGIIS